MRLRALNSIAPRLWLAAVLVAGLVPLAGCSGVAPADEAADSGPDAPGADEALHTISTESTRTSTESATMAKDVNLATATFGNGCFWCTEAVFEELRGVESAVSGYIGGAKPNPTYEDVCTGTTGHAEAIELKYDPEQVSYEQLLEVFWKTHDPTTLNRQGNDVGTQYRSAVFYHDDEQRRLAQEYKKKLDESGAYGQPIVTEITPASEFYPAEDYHQQYFELHGHAPYCQAVIRPKLDKFREVFKDQLKDGA